MLSLKLLPTIIEKTTALRYNQLQHEVKLKHFLSPAKDLKTRKIPNKEYFPCAGMDIILLYNYENYRRLENTLNRLEENWKRTHSDQL